MQDPALDAVHAACHNLHNKINNILLYFRKNAESNFDYLQSFFAELQYRKSNKYLPGR